VGALLGEHGRVVLVETVVEDLVGLALLGQRLAELRERDRAFALAADVHHDHAGAVVDRVDHGLDDLSGGNVLDRGVQLGGELLVGDRAHGSVELPFEFGGVDVVLLDPAGSESHEKGSLG
ncbi:MAG: hypothetical protein ACK55I_32395, partial [bacterium]